MRRRLVFVVTFPAVFVYNLSIFLHPTLLHSTLLYSTLLYSTLLHSALFSSLCCALQVVKRLLVKNPAARLCGQRGLRELTSDPPLAFFQVCECACLCVRVCMYMCLCTCLCMDMSILTLLT